MTQLVECTVGRRAVDGTDPLDDESVDGSARGRAGSRLGRIGAAAIIEGPVLRQISKDNRTLATGLHPELVNDLVQAPVARAELGGGPARSPRAGFVTPAAT